MKKKSTFRDWVTLLTFGVAGTLGYHLIVGIVALLLGLLVAAFSVIQWYVAALICYLGGRLVLEGFDAFAELRTTRCTECKRKIITSNPIKCEECGGAGRLVGKKYGAKS